MTTMELNLRKEQLYQLIYQMDENRVEKLERYIKQVLQTAPKYPANYSWSPSKEELLSLVAEAELNYKKGNYINEEEMDAFIENLK